MNYSKKLMIITALLFASQYIVAQTSGYQKLDEWVTVWKSAQQTTFGYPANQVSPLHSFYEWYVQTGMDVVNLNNAGDPMTDQPERLSSQAFEREVIEFFAPLYDFDKGNVWL